MSKFIKVKNELPELLEALCNHDDCPDWLSDEIWDAFNDRNNSSPLSANYFRYLMEATADAKNCEYCERPIKPRRPHLECQKRLDTESQPKPTLRLVSKSEVIQ